MAALRSPQEIEILIVEDELIGAAYIETIIRELGFSVIGIATALGTALEIINSGRKIDCATLDVRLGEDLSSPVASALLTRNIPFVVCSAYSIFLRDFPEVPILQKPFSAPELADALSRAMRIVA